MQEQYPAADPERSYVAGSSMGGSGALTLGLLWARHFAVAEGALAQLVQRNHRPARLAQLEALWGRVSDRRADASGLEDGRVMNIWDRVDLTRVMDECHEAREQFLFLKNGKDDATVHFGAVVMPSPLTSRRGYESLQAARIGHFAVWDEGGHGTLDPVMGAEWWDADWSRIADAQAYLRRDLAFPAFSRSSADEQPGDGTGNGRRAFSNVSGYAGDVSVPGDTGWTGELAGALNRFLRWDATRVVDTIERLEIPLVLASGGGSSARRAGYPTVGDRYDGPLPIRADVTPRRVQRFRCRPGETVRWTYGTASGLATANDQGEVTVTQLPIGRTPITLVLERIW